MIELLAPAGDLEKLKIALLYGADAVFIGGKEFSLRARASNFTIDDIKEAVEFAHSLGKKIYVTTNIIPHHEDMKNLIEYLKELESAKVDAIIAASPYIIETALKHTNLEVHISTQQSVMNHQTVNYWHQKGATRVVLARDLTLVELNEIMKNVNCEIEVFIHGGMCAGYSGRCSLSNHFTNRDANRGGCAHSCRWFYDFKQDNQKIEDTPFTMSSKDLTATRQITRLIDMNVSSLKIEGRMKSLHYIATIVRAYRSLIDEYTKTKTIKDYEYYENIIKKAENREVSTGFFENIPKLEQQLFEKRSEKVMQNFVGLILDYNEETMIATVEQRNVFYEKETLEVFSPKNDDRSFIVDEIITNDYEKVESARKAKQILYIKIPFKVEKYDMLRGKR